MFRSKTFWAEMKTYFWWIESLFMTATIPVAILLVEIITIVFQKVFLLHLEAGTHNKCIT
jgi:hypothetical protein